MNRIAEGGDNQPAVPQANSPPQTQNPTLGVGASAFQYQALTALSKNCAACHTGVGAKKGMIIFSQPGYFNPNANLKKIKDQIDSGHMPPPDSQFHLNQQEKGTISEWLRLKGVN